MVYLRLSAVTMPPTVFISPSRPSRSHSVCAQGGINGAVNTKVGKLKDILSEHPGDSPVYVHLESPEKTTVLRLGDDHLVDAGTGLYAELRILLGADCIT